jgi:hypothetical protein
MTTYRIDDQHDNEITVGLPEQTAHATAQRIANTRGETVYLSEDRPDTMPTAVFPIPRNAARWEAYTRGGDDCAEGRHCKQQPYHAGNSYGHDPAELNAEYHRGWADAITML